MQGAVPPTKSTLAMSQTDMSWLVSLQRIGFKITSTVFVFLYLIVLLVMAFINHFKSRSKQHEAKLPAKELKLTRNMAYYVELAGYTLEDHNVVTSDGFVLDMSHIVSARPGPKYPVLLIPGLMQSSAAFLTAGPDSIAIELVRQGYDVWFGNNRGGFKGEHSEFNRWLGNQMWQWDMNDLAHYDFPKMLEVVLQNTGAPHCAVVGHSQGTAQTFLALSLEKYPELGTKVSSFTALAPAVYAGSLIDRWYLKLLRHGGHAWHAMMGYGPFLGPMFSLEKLLPLKVSSKFGYAMFNYLLGWNDLLWDRRYRDRNFVFAPVYVSSKHMQWWLGTGGFADTKCLFDESKPHWFDERFPPVALFVCGRDELCDGKRLINRLETLEGIQPEVFYRPSYSHLDILWARDAAQQVAQPMGNFIWEHVPDKEKWESAWELGTRS